MHMSDALLSPTVGGTMWAVSAGAIAYSSKKVRQELDDRKVPLMGVLGAFLFAAQMINFTIPATGSSGHLGGGILLAILLGPYAGLLVIASVLVVQALFFADGGLLALGCNIFNMGILPAFVVYPLVYKSVAGTTPTPSRIRIATMLAAVVGLQLGPLSVVLETVLSGISALPLSTFAFLMLPIHLAIGIVEGLATVAIIAFVHRARPEIIDGAIDSETVGNKPIRSMALAFLVVALITGGLFSWFASKNPDGLEWAIAKVTGKEELEGPKHGLHRIMSNLQEKTAFLPDYSFKKPEQNKEAIALGKEESNPTKKDDGSKLGTSLAGVIGSLIVLGIGALVGLALKRCRNCSGKA